MIKKVIEVFRTEDGEFPDEHRRVCGFSLDVQEWISCYYVNRNWYSSLDGGTIIVSIDFWTELCETFEDDIC